MQLLGAGELHAHLQANNLAMPMLAAHCFSLRMLTSSLWSSYSGLRMVAPRGFNGWLVTALLLQAMTSASQSWLHWARQGGRVAAWSTCAAVASSNATITRLEGLIHLRACMAGM
jgi:hypothetical protein